LVIKTLFFLKKKKEELMTGGTYSLNKYSSNYWGGELGRDIWPVTFEPSERLEAGRDPAHPGFIFSPLHGVMEVWHPSKRRLPWTVFASD
jgi:hypothetical protein